MPKYAAGKYAYGISDRSGFRYRLKDMRREWTGFLVGKDEWEPKHPQLEPRRHATDAEALRNPRPDTNNIFSVDVTFPAFDLSTLQFIPTVKANTSVGTVTLGGSVVTPVQPTGVSATTALNSVTITTTGGASVSFSVTGSAATSAVGSVSQRTDYTVTVATGTNGYGTGNKYYIAGLSGASPTLTLYEGTTYRFDQSDSSNSGHPFRFSTTANGTHGGGTEYTSGVTTYGVPGNSGAYTEITVASGAPTLYYYCTQHSGMGGQANTP